MKAHEEKLRLLQEKISILEAGEINDDDALTLIDECIKLAGECAEAEET